MASIWETLGEKVGYALAAVVLGPPAAMARRERRALRSALNSWCDDLGAIRVAAPGLTKRAGKLPVTGGSFPFEVTLDAFRKRATLDVAGGTLPPHARATLSRAAPTVTGIAVKYRMTPSLRRELAPIVEVDDVRVDSGTLDAATGKALARELAASALGKLNAFVLEIESERLVLDVLAPASAVEWKDLGDALAAFADSCVRRWGSSYR